MNPGFRNNFSGFWDIHSDQMMHPNEAQDRYRPGQLFLRQQIQQNTFPPQKKLRLKCPFLYEGRKKNDSFSIVCCIYVEKIEIKT